MNRVPERRSLRRTPRPATLPLLQVLPLALVVLTAHPDAPLRAQENGAIDGRVVHDQHADQHAGDEGITLVDVRLVDLGRRAAAALDGSFSFTDVPAGSYVLHASGPGGSGAARVEVTAGEVARVDISLRVTSHDDEVVVSAGEARLALELAQPIDSLNGLELDLRRQATLGETLNGVAGVTSTSFGQGASRPIIRGQSGDRVRMLEGGVDMGDASSVSADHAVASDTMLATSIEVLRGPSTLLYGSSAIGGAVNVVDERIPTYRAISPVSGSVEVRAASAADEQAAAVLLEGGKKDWAYHFGVTSRDAGDYDIPGFASVEETEGPTGLSNSDLATQSARFGVSRFFGDLGFVGVSLGGFDSDYGIPGVPGAGEVATEADEPPVRIDMQQRRLDLRAEINRPLGIFRGWRARVGATDYEHTELEGLEVGTRFFNEAIDGRFELVQRPSDSSSGSVGIQFTSRDLEAIGEEAFIPASTSDRLSLFAFQEIERGSVTWQVGARFEDQTLSAVGFRDVSHSGVSGSIGLVWTISDAWAVVSSVARSVKLPITEELFSNGAHVATQTFEVGSPELHEEASLGLDLALRRSRGTVQGELSLFRNDFDDFIYEAPIGRQEEGLPVVVYTQSDATFEGFELDTRTELVTFENGADLHLSVGGDYVQARLDERNESLPRIPPMRAWVGLHLHSTRWNSMLEVRWTDDASDLAPNETPTDGFVMLNASIGHRVFFGSQVFDLLLRGRNLTDEDARRHTSYLKDTVPLPGRDVSLSLKLLF